MTALSASATSVLLSAERFTQPLARPDRHGARLDLLAEARFRLRLVVFLRDQPDYIDTRFVHSTSRPHHHQSFERPMRPSSWAGPRIAIAALMRTPPPGWPSTSPPPTTPLPGACGAAAGVSGYRRSRCSAASSSRQPIAALAQYNTPLAQVLATAGPHTMAHN